ncbi:hypothetical protein NM208_g4726 [Fusarium decemcellulare]|uniref:Uncharacterized protein n=1 Tax=Fusarium decemcellulare TaxID=57161 RepID=A0ACC1SJR9_9HYPO|nr:hypothetical protein NM208_g4726 [Fusarium decemcellulare]
MFDPQFTEKPVSIAFLRELSQLTPDAAELFRRSKDAAERRGIIPILARDAVIDRLDPLDFELAKDSFYDMASRANQSGEASASNLTGKAQITCVYNPLLAVALKPFVTQLSYCDVSRASINQQYLTKHPDNDVQDDSWTRLRGATDHELINRSSANPLRSQPIAISVEIKSSGGSTHEAWTRLYIWATSYLERLRALMPSRTFIDRKGVGIVLCLVGLMGDSGRYYL